MLYFLSQVFLDVAFPWFASLKATQRVLPALRSDTDHLTENAPLIGSEGRSK